MRTALLLSACLLAAAPTVGLAQPAAASRPFKAPQNALGQPDLSGFWTSATMTPLSRPANLGARATYSEQEVKQLEQAEIARLAEGDKPIDPSVQRIETPSYRLPGIDGAAYDLAFIDPGTSIMRVGGEPRTSLITTPNGRPPAIKAGATPRQTPRSEAIFTDYPGKNDNMENRSLGERCVIGFGRVGGPPMTPGLYNNTYQLVQSRDGVAIVVEMVHDVRNVRLNAKHRTDGVRPWFGDSIGWYEGDVLVVETTNIPAGQAFQGAWENLKVTERFRRVAPDRLHYQFRIEDPTMWDEAWGGEYEMAAAGPVYEYACHEGNYGLQNIMAGARADDALAAAAGSRGN